MLPKDELVKVFIEAMGEENWELVKKGERRVVNTCGSGMTVRFLRTSRVMVLQFYLLEYRLPRTGCDLVAGVTTSGS